MPPERGVVDQENIRYLKTHQLHRVFDELVQRLTQMRPENPQRFIVDFLRAHCGKGPAPVPTPAPAAPAAATAPPAAPAQATDGANAANADSPTPVKTQARKKARQRTQTMLKNDKAAPAPPQPSELSPEEPPLATVDTDLTPERKAEIESEGQAAAMERCSKREERRRQAAAARQRVAAGKEAATDRCSRREDRRKAAAQARAQARVVAPAEGAEGGSTGRKASRTRSASGMRAHDRDEAEAPPAKPRRLSEKRQSVTAEEVSAFWKADELKKHACKAILEPDTETVKFHKLFYSCAATRRRPAALLNAWTMLAYTRENAEKRWQATRKSAHPEAVWINYDLSIYENVVIVFTDKGPIYPAPEELHPFDDFVATLCDTKGTYVEVPIRDKDITRSKDDLSPLVKKCVHITMQGWRSTQEDAHLHMRLTDKLAVFAVFDGHGGTLASEWIANTLPKYFLQLAPEADDPKKLAEVLQEAMEKCDAQLEEENAVETGTVGTTCCLVAVTPTHYVCLNIGDSRAVLCRNAETVALSTDHTLDDEKEVKRVTGAGYEVRKGRIEGMLSVPRAFGDFDFKQCGGKSPAEQAVSIEADVVIVERGSGDEFIIVGCDGIWDGYDNEEAVSIIREGLGQGKTDQEVVVELLDKNLPDEIDEEAIGTDNQTCILVSL